MTAGQLYSSVTFFSLDVLVSARAKSTELKLLLRRELLETAEACLPNNKI